METKIDRPKRLILIDDDPTYNAIMLRAAEQVGIQLDTFTSLTDLGSVAFFGRYDAAIVDYQLEQMTGLDIAEYLTVLFDDVPMLLVSQGENFPKDARQWPEAIAAFLPKASGYRHVIETAQKLAMARPKAGSGV